MKIMEAAPETTQGAAEAAHGKCNEYRGFTCSSGDEWPGAASHHNFSKFATKEAVSTGLVGKWLRIFIVKKELETD